MATITPQCKLRRVVFRDFCGYTVFMARPPKKPGETRENVLRIRLTEAERKAIDEAALGTGLDSSTWARMQLLAISKKQKKQ